ncbi:MAG: hypothetical protein NVSMB51_09100 [Solirubrobacteraceae bacterium]
MIRGRRLLVATFLVAGFLPVSAAPGDVAGPDESIGQAFGPLVAGSVYSGSFNSPTDMDYLAFDVAQPGQTLHFDVTNTVHGCLSPNLTGCPLYATLIDSQGLQLGGAGSSAGTGPVSEDYRADVIDWTFDAAGRYYVAVDSDGDLPTYTLHYAVSSSGTGNAIGSGGGRAGAGGAPKGDAAGSDQSAPGSARAITSLRVSSHQRGTTVRARLNIGRALRSLKVQLETTGARARTFAVKRLREVRPGRRTFALPLDASARLLLVRRGRLTLRVAVSAAPGTGATQTVARPVHLRPR